MRKNKRTPGNRNVMRSVHRKASSHVCSGCGCNLHGVGRMSTSKFAGSASSQKRVSRIFGGSMCPWCSRSVLRERARSV